MPEKIIDRLLKYLKQKGIPKTRFEKEAGLSNGYLGTQEKRGGDLGEEIILKIIDNCLELNIEWLITGKGEMEKKLNKPADSVELKLSGSKGTPLVRTEALGGIGSVSFAIEENDILSRYVVPDFENIDFMLRVRGSSMAPKYNSGDVVACRILKEKAFIQWNMPHVIATEEQGILIKRLKKGSTHEVILAVSDNKDYDPFEIPWAEVKGIALVIGVIRLE